MSKACYFVGHNLTIRYNVVSIAASLALLMKIATTVKPYIPPLFLLPLAVRNIIVMCHIFL
jgi:hypothetical protein